MAMQIDSFIDITSKGVLFYVRIKQCVEGIPLSDNPSLCHRRRLRHRGRDGQGRPRAQTARGSLHQRDVHGGRAARLYDDMQRRRLYVLDGASREGHALARRRLPDHGRAGGDPHACHRHHFPTGAGSEYPDAGRRRDPGFQHAGPDRQSLYDRRLREPAFAPRDAAADPLYDLLRLLPPVPR